MLIWQTSYVKFWFSCYQNNNTFTIDLCWSLGTFTHFFYSRLHQSSIHLRWLQQFHLIFPLSAISDALEVFTNFKHYIEKHLQLTIKIVQIDWGWEFRNFSSLLTVSGIHFRHHCPHIHHQNGKIKRKHRHIVDIGLTLLA